MVVASVLLGGVVRADYFTSFAASPYGLNQSIIGVDGWEFRVTNRTDNASARVVAVPWNNEKPALLLQGANLKNITFKPTTSDRVKVTVQLAVNFPDGGPPGNQVRVGFHALPFGELIFDQGAAGGLGYNGSGFGRGGTIVLRKNEIQQNSFYTYSVLVDFTKQKYDIAITGTKSDGTPFEYKAAGVAFESKLHQIKQIYIITGSQVTAYLGTIAIESL
ncbi:MAG: hypothetical protein PCFJNLEI_03954 [Verrucomicrobiae bacterium]|nr:hypothetical protein [Verrucomicrobiae bacterium]